ncbi:TPA: hypothetical protein MHZ27_00365 [Klebsiella pneumoniae subsp. pneumoniae]|nr:hypothetical protein [Klebsiella pneumoniae subsp. pneumoniae]
MTDYGGSKTPKNERDYWQTPIEIFNALDREFGFWLDAAASESNALCAHYLTELDDSLNSEWTSSIHMPRWASRIQLEITGVRVERLQSITLGDICKEIGCGLYDFRPATYGFQVWEELWKSIYGAESWNANPWVWVIEFKRIEGGAA